MNTGATLQDADVAIATCGRADYEDNPGARIWRALLQASEKLGWCEEERGPFARLIPQGARVVIKPNLVLHQNQSPWGLDPLITHRSVIQCALSAACLAGAREVAIADAPIQGCDFSTLMRVSGLGEWSRNASVDFPAFTGISDLRRSSWLKTTAAGDQSGTASQGPYILFDLGADSVLEPITDKDGRFRVTCYNPAVLSRSHAPGRHQYLVSAKVLEADVIVNLPKLKMHKKAGVTCALKNFVGTCGDKAYLPHHRAGGSSQKGDCYPGASHLKAMMEYTTARQNATTSSTISALWRGTSRALGAMIRRSGDQLGIEGAWSGNDTVWRMCLDLNRILLYGRADGTLTDSPQRQLIHFVDAIVAGQGDGPLAPEPLPLGVILLAQNGAATDWAGAYLLGFDPHQIPLVQHAFAPSPWPLATFDPSEIEVVGDLITGRADEVLPITRLVSPTHYPEGWRHLAMASATRGNTVSPSAVPEHARRQPQYR